MQSSLVSTISMVLLSSLEKVYFFHTMAISYLLGFVITWLTLVLLTKLSFSSSAMSNVLGCDYLLNGFHDQCEGSYCKTPLRKTSVWWNVSNWLLLKCRYFKRSAVYSPGFQCPRCISKAAHDDCNVPTPPLPSSPLPKAKAIQPYYRNEKRSLLLMMPRMGP